MNEVEMSFEEGLEIVDKARKQLILKGTITAKTDKEKAIIMDSLNLIETEIENEKRRIIVGIRWDEMKKSKLLSAEHN